MGIIESVQDYMIKFNEEMLKKRALLIKNDEMMWNNDSFGWKGKQQKIKVAEIEFNKMGPVHGR